MLFDYRPLRKIEQKANDILLTCGIKEPPVPVKEIVLKLGLNAISYDFGADISGILVLENGKGTIGFNPKDSKTRQRFTMAHELGHYLFHNNLGSEVFIDKDFIVKYRSKQTYSDLETRQEKEANIFAAALLMPKEMLKAQFANEKYHGLSETDFIGAVAKIFDVSIQAMTYRLANSNFL
jgi:Zn-dependent peptidase ImmA (M78 family)